ncbi:sodium channel protein Nach isoform X1 [Athalia rosae]|uniref:sodium channel protein Nach isoform X1 n=1 Tax=Athalia rosae TaxID=37344 RepID=UPI002033912C|nr:sodium channel protein Nach isoform X1 [Athalia rosae]
MRIPEEYKPSKESLKTSLKTRSKEYPRVAALHGIAYVADVTRPKIERIGWLICLLISLVAILVIIVTLMEKFQTNPMLSSMEIHSDDVPLDFPNIYFCPPWISSNNHTQGTKEQQDDTWYEELYKWDARATAFRNLTYPTSLNNVRSLKNYFFENYGSLCIFVQRLTLAGRELDCSSFDKVMTTRGICFVVSSSDIIIDDVDILLNFYAAMFPIRVYVTLPDQTNFLKHLSFHNFIFPSMVGMKFHETITSADAKVLTRSQRNCFFPGEQSPYVECMLDCEIKNSLKLCGCVAWYLAKDGVKECSINKYQCLSNHAVQIADTSRCRCLLSCDNIFPQKIEIQVYPPEEGLCAIKISVRSKLKYTRTILFGWSDLMVSFGGIAGLFLGLSLLSTIEFGYYFTLRTYCGAVLDAPRHRHNITKINVLELNDLGQLGNVAKHEKQPRLREQKAFNWSSRCLVRRSTHSTSNHEGQELYMALHNSFTGMQ